MSVGGQLWADTGDVDPVLARVVHLLHHHWDDGDDPSCARMLAELDLVIAGTIGDDALSRQRALLSSIGYFVRTCRDSCALFRSRDRWPARRPPVSSDWLRWRTARLPVASSG